MAVARPAAASWRDAAAGGWFDRVRWLFGLAFAACLLSQFSAARCVLPNADTVQDYTEMLAVRSGNVLLHGWVLTTDTYILSDLPVFVLGSVVVGPTLRLLYLVPAAVFAGFLAACCVLTGGRPGRRLVGFATLYLLGAPVVALGGLLLPAVHAAALTLCLFALVAVRPALCGEGLRRWRLLAFGLLGFAAAASDPFCVAYLFAPLLLLVPLRFWLSPRWRGDEWWLAGATVAALALAAGFDRLIASAGGFTLAPGPEFGFVPSLGDAAWNGYGVLRGLQTMFAARAAVLPGSIAMPLIVASRAVAAIVVATLCGRVVWRMPRGGGMLAQLLVLGALCVAVLASVSSPFLIARSFGATFPTAATRYVMPAFVFACLAAALELRALLTTARRCRLAAMLLASLAVPVAAGALETGWREARQPAGILRTQQGPLCDWLIAHGLRHGVGDYWTAGMVTALSRGAVHETPVRMLGATLRPFAWVADMTDLAAHRPEFAAFLTGTPYGLTPATLTAAYGPAEAVQAVGEYTVVVFARADRAGR